MILAVDTCGLHCGVALWENRLVDFIQTEGSLRHNETLYHHLRELLDRNQVQWEDLQSVAVSSGPGSFTGLRVGMAAAKGLCWTLKIPLIAIPTLEGLAAAVPARLKRALPLMPARAREIYWRLYEHDGEHWNPQGECSVSEVASLNEIVRGSVFLCGEGYDRHQEELNRRFSGRRLTLADSESLEPLVVSTARLAGERFSGGQFADLIKSEPEYFYPFPRIIINPIPDQG